MFFILLIATLVAAAITIGIIKVLSWPFWAFHPVSIGMGVALLALSSLITQSSIQKNALDLANKEELIPGVQAWEMTAGTGVVPKWVSLIGTVGIGFILASPFELFASLFR